MTAAMMASTIDQFRDAAERRGIVLPDHIEADGVLHRCDVVGKKGHRDGAYLLHLDGVPAGGFQNHRDGIGWESWRADVGRALTPAEEAAHRAKVEAQRRQRAADEERQREAAAIEAAIQLRRAKPGAKDHAYVKAKGIHAYGARTDGSDLLIPLRDADGKLHSVQRIASNGQKRFLPFGRKRGCFFSIGKPNGVVCVTEGFATGASVHEATGHAVAIAFDAGNLEPVTAALREKFPAITIAVCADDDVGTDGNPGIAKARDAAAAVNGIVAVPDFGDNRPPGATDFNDLHQAHGLDAVRACIEKVLTTCSPQRHEHLRDGVSTFAEGDQDVVRLMRASELAPEAIRWLWLYWLALGKLAILAGPPGGGKTTIAAAFAATVSSGGRWPDGSRCDPGNVLFWSGEDDPADTLLPRLLAGGADPKRVFFVTGTRAGNEVVPFDPARDMVHLTAQAQRIGDVRLLVVDPVVSVVTTDSHKNTEVRRALQPLVDLAAALDCAVLGITHFTKGSGGREPTERVTGSVAFGAVARVVMVAAKAKADDGREYRVLARSKSNIGPDDGGFEYEIEQRELDGHPGVAASVVLWGAALAGTARDLLAEPEQEHDKGARDLAADWLRELLDGPTPSNKVKDEAKAAGFAWATVRRAADSIGVLRKKAGMDRGWYWSLPKMLNKAKPAEDAQQNPKVLIAHGEDFASTFADAAAEHEPEAAALAAGLAGDEERF